MNALYAAIGISRQAFHRHVQRALARADEQEQILLIVQQLRFDHPRMSAKKMYLRICPQFLGRDRFIDLCFTHGYRLHRARSLRRTTDSRGVIRFENLLVGVIVKGINRVWVSDLTYYEVGGRFYYLTFILDVYSRIIVGYSVSATMVTEETTLVALEMALSDRACLPGLIFHSDGGGQYYSIDFLKVTRANGIRNSMCAEAWQNPYAERVNGIIKNEYLVGYLPVDEKELREKTRKAVRMYNMERPHGSIKNMSPYAFERSGISLPVKMNMGEKTVRKKRADVKHA